jgi:4-hydroxybenzoate polyprenyltransferase
VCSSDLVGNDSADLEVWRFAGRAHVVGASPGLLSRAKAQGNLGQVFANAGPSWAVALFKALRPHQWVKNLLVLVPLFAAHRYGDQASLALALLAFVAFGLAASSVYLLNDLVDLGDDRHHPRKRRRPLASGDLSLVSGWLTWPLLLLCAFALSALLLPPLFTGILAVYFLATLAYSLRLKRMAIVDVVTLAGLYTLRIIAGVAAISVPLSFWLLTFSMFLFLSLAFVKRYSELKTAGDAGGHGQIRGRGYSVGDMPMVSTMGTAAGSIAVLVLALYIQDSHTAELYHTPRLIWLACPLLLYWISRVWLIAQRGQMHDDPIVFALKDRTSWLVAACFLGVFVLARLGA